jgi:hypothetical protein
LFPRFPFSRDFGPVAVPVKKDSMGLYLTGIYASAFIQSLSQPPINELNILW